MSCPICLNEEIVDKHTTICNHDFCKICIDTWLEKKNTCPCCRAKLKEELEEAVEVEVYGVDEDGNYIHRGIVDGLFYDEEGIEIEIEIEDIDVFLDNRPYIPQYIPSFTTEQIASFNRMFENRNRYGR